MFRPADLIIDAFIDFLRKSHLKSFGDADPDHWRAIERAARMSLPRIASSDALYHDLGHAIMVVQVGQDLLKGRMIDRGDVRSLDWVHFVSALLCLNVGFCKGAVEGDQDRRRVINLAGEVRLLQEGNTDGGLWKVVIDRSQLFVRARFSGDSVLSADRLAALIDKARFPRTDLSERSGSLADLMLDANLIGGLANPRFMKRLAPFFLEMKESNVHLELGLSERSDFYAIYADFFWSQFAPCITHGMKLLAYTGPGRQWLANLRAHVLRREHDL